MSKIRNNIGASLLAISIALGGINCATIHSESTSFGAPVRPTTIANPKVFELSKEAKIRNQQKETIGSQMVSMLGKEFFKVKHYLMNTHEGGKDLVIRGYYKYDEGIWSAWGINLDNMCRAYHEQIKLVKIIPLKDFVYTETAFGEIIKSPNFGGKVATQLTEMLTLYMGNNGERCENWLEFTQKNYGPIGPAE